MIVSPGQTGPGGCSADSGEASVTRGEAPIYQPGGSGEEKVTSAEAARGQGHQAGPLPWSWWARPQRNRGKTRVGPFAADDNGGVILWIGLFLGVLAVGALLIDVSMLYVAKQRAQIVADAAVVAAAATPDPIVGAQASTQAVATAVNVGEVNGYKPADIVTIATDSPRGDGSIVLETTVTNDVALGFSFLSSTGHGAVGAAAFAGATPAAAPCLWSVGVEAGGLDGNINISGNAVVQGPNCTAKAVSYFEAGDMSNVTLSKIQVGIGEVQEAGYLKAPTATLVDPGGVEYNVTNPKTSFDTPFNSDSRIATLQLTMQNMVATWDFGGPVASNPHYPVPPLGIPSPGNAVLTYVSQTGITLPNAPYGRLVATNSEITFAGSGAPDPTCTNPTTFQYDWTFTGTNTITFNTGCYVVGTTFMANTGSVVTFKVAPGADVVFVLAGGSMYDYGNVTFGDLTTIIRGGTVYVEANASLTFGNGPWWFWGGSIATLALNSSLTVGNGPFYMYGGTITNNGTMTFADGPLYLQGGSFVSGASSTTTFGNGPFWFYGGSMTFGANSTNSFGVGDLWFYGGSIANYGTWTLGPNGGAVNGNVTIYLYGGSYYITASSGGFIARGYTIGLLGGTIYLTGNGPLEFTAPMTASTPGEPNRGYQEVLMALLAPKGSTSNGATSIYQSKDSSAILSGLIYSPMGNVSIYGYSRAPVLPPGGCLQIVAHVIDIYGNASVQLAPCTSFNQTTGVANVGKLVE